MPVQHLPKLPEKAATAVHRVKAALGQVAATAQAKVVYTYDFGDDWRHDIVVEQVVQAEPGVSYPRCTGGRRSAPREDSGGIWAHNENSGDDLPFAPGEELACLAQVLIPA